MKIYRRLQTQKVVVMLCCSKKLKSCKRFKDGHMSISDDSDHSGSQDSAVTPGNIHHVENFKLDKRCIICCDISQEINLSVGMVNTIIQEHLRFQKSIRWVPRQLFTFDWHRKKSWSLELKDCFGREGQDFLEHIITCDKNWVHNFTLESKWASKQHMRAHSLPPKIFWAIASVSKVMSSVFWDKHDIIHADFSTPSCQYQQWILLLCSGWCAHSSVKKKKKKPNLIT